MYRDKYISTYLQCLDAKNNEIIGTNESPVQGKLDAVTLPTLPLLPTLPK